MSDMAIELVPRPFTVDEYHRMAEAGVIGPRERIELLDGSIVEMSPIGIPHWTSCAHIIKYLIGMLGERAIVAGEISIPLGDRDEPQPDIAVLAKLPYRRLQRTPEPSEIYAIVELAETSLAKDTGTKRRLYGRFGIADYMVVDLAADVLMHFSRPAGGDYPAPRILRRGDRLTWAALPEIALLADPFLDER